MFAEDKGGGGGGKPKIKQKQQQQQYQHHQNSNKLKISKSNNNNSNLIRPQVRRAIAQCDTWEVGVCDPNLDHPIISTESSKKQNKKKVIKNFIT